MKKYLLLPIVLLISACQDVGDNKPLLSNTKKKQPVIIVNPNRHLNIAEFWIDHLQEADEVIMDSKEIEELNNDTAYKKRTLTYFKDIHKFYTSQWLKIKLLKNLNGLKKRVSYIEDDNRISGNFYREIKKNMNLNGFSKKNVTTRYALVTGYCNQKIIPTEQSLLKKKNQIYFDRNQNSALDIGTPVAVLHTTVDGAWHYGIGPTSSGWVRDSDIAFGTRNEILNYLSSKNFIVTISAKSPLLIAGRYHDYVRMGVRIPYLMSVDDMMMVLIPTRDEEGGLVLSNATLKSLHTHKGYLPYTQKNILTQAFKFLHMPYGWGGMYGEQDCSKFLQEIYATTGLRIPRNSASQSNMGNAQVELNNFNKDSRHQQLNKWAKAGVSILHLKGHIVLYLGNYKGEPFIIHTVWGSSSRHYALGRTAVTSLNFNGYLGKIDRITNLSLQ